MENFEITKTELVWPGKYNEDATRKEVPRVSLPFQVIETINESRVTREANKLPRQPSLFDIYEGKEGDTFEEAMEHIRDVIIICLAEIQEEKKTVDLRYPEVIGMKQIEVTL